MIRKWREGTWTRDFIVVSMERIGEAGHTGVGLASLNDCSGLQGRGAGLGCGDWLWRGSGWSSREVVGSELWVGRVVFQKDAWGHVVYNL